MKKLAIFTEGGTEQHFVERLLKEVMSGDEIRIEKTKIRGGSAFPRRPTRIEIDAFKDAQKFFIVIHDCGTDNRVQSDIRENWESLKLQKFETVIGIRDTYPYVIASEISKIKQRLYYKIPTADALRAVMVLAITEVEAWFLAEYTHFSRIHATLTLDAVKAALGGFDPSVDDVECRNHPAGDLHATYQTVGEVYTKAPAIIQRTIDALDYNKVYCNLPTRVPSFKGLIDAIETFFT